MSGLFSQTLTPRRITAAMFTILLTTTLSAEFAYSAPGGELDASFGDNGRLQLLIADSTFGQAVVQQAADGKLVFVGVYTGGTSGSDFAVLRLNPDGSPDDTFGMNGLVSIDFGGSDDAAYDLVLQPDGKIVVVGEADMGVTGNDLALVRLNPDGSIDATFDGDGRVTLDLGGTFDYASQIVRLPNGQFVVAGATIPGAFLVAAPTGSDSDSDIVVARFNADGALDTTFGTGSSTGTTLIDANGNHDSPHALLVQPDGKLLVCGSDWFYADVQFYGLEMLAIRLNADGSLDTGFANNGVFDTNTGWSAAVTCLVLPDNDILLAGWASTGLSLVRLAPDGSMDTTFANSGTSRIYLGNSDYVYSMILLAGGTIGITGSFATINPNTYDNPADMFLANIDPDSGQLVSGFGNNGVSIVDFGTGNQIPGSYGSRLIQQPDGKILAAGLADGSSLAIARVDPAGNGNAGFAGLAETTSATVVEGTPHLAVTVRRTGGGTGSLSVDYATVADTAMPPGDFTATSGTLTWTSGDMEPKSITVPITSDSTAENDEQFAIVLTNSTSGLAASEFGVTINEMVSAPPPASPPPASPPRPPSGGGATSIVFLLLLSMLRLLRKVSGLVTRRLGAALGVALLATALSAEFAYSAPEGELDATFGDNGRLIFGQGILEFGYGRAIAQQAVDGKLLIAGDNGGSRAAVVRLNGNGSLDSTFGTNGTAEVDFGGEGEQLYGLALQPNGKIVVAGHAYTDLATGIPESDFALARLNPDGTNDSTFGGDGLVTLDLGASYEFIFGLALLPNGQIVVAGTTDTNGDADMAFARFNSDGLLDATFGTGTIAGTTVVDVGGSNSPNDEPRSITRQQDGKLVACGISNTDYWDYPGTMTAVRMNPDGSLDTGFGINGIAQIEESSWAQACIAMPGGAIVLAGGQASDLVFARLKSDGTRDETFGDLGISRIDLGGYDSVQAMILLSDGNLGVTGRNSTIRENIFGAPTDMFFARVDPDSGFLDPSFGNDGVTIVDFGFANWTAYSEGAGIIQQADGKLVAVGIAGTGYNEAPFAAAVARVETEGSGNAGFAGWTYTSDSVAEGTGEFVASVRRTGGSTGALSVDYNTVAGSAVATSDFSATFGTLTWANGDMDPKSVTVPITSDSNRENDEFFTILLSNSTSGLAASQILVTISEPAAPGSTSGGGGSMGVDLLVLLAITAASAVRRRRIISSTCRAGAAR